MKLLLISEVARRLGLSLARVRDLDDKLIPMRTENGTRLYRADAIDAFAVERAAAPIPPLRTR